MVQEEIRKGPWTEYEDAQLIFYVNLFGDRRWDFIAKVSGLKRTGKSCRLRWVNYLHPGLRRGKMTPHEERLVLELHAKWGNRWSRIARKLPGRTDNEIKNYWRTHMRKKTQEMKQTSSPPLSRSYSSLSSINDMKIIDNGERSFYDTGGVFGPSSLVDDNIYSSFVTNETKYYDMGGLEMLIPKKKSNEEEKREKVNSMDDIWKDIDLPESNDLNNLSSEIVIAPIWNHCPDSSWVTEEDVQMNKMVFPSITDNLLECYGLEDTNLNG